MKQLPLLVAVLFVLAACGKDKPKAAAIALDAGAGPALQQDDALAAMSKAAALGEKSKEMYTVYGRCLVDQKRWEEALAAYAKGDPNSTDQLKIAQMYAFLATSKSDTLLFSSR